VLEVPLQLSYFAKSLFIFLFFSFILDLLYRRECGKVSHHMISHDRSYDRHRKLVHRLCSSCISSVKNLMGTLSSSPCQILIKGQLALFQLWD